MDKRHLWKIGGEAGFGIMTTGQMFSKIATRHGYQIFEYFEYPSLIRGGHNTVEIIVSSDPVSSTKSIIDILVCLNNQTYQFHKHRLSKNSLVVYDSSDFNIDEGDILKIDLPFKRFLKEEGAPLVMMNNIAMGASLALMGWDLKILNQMITNQFQKKGEDIVKKNEKMAQLGFDFITTKYNDKILTLPETVIKEPQLVLTGNDAFALGSIIADCRLYSAYPMTPSSTVLTTLADYAEKVGMVVRHAEDEISVINTALGAAFAGCRAAVGTSGGGFALMVESVSLAGIAEIPIVIFLSQRPGPATGLPTWTEQGDLLFAIHSGHGEFPKIVLAPGDVDEMYECTTQAFDLADIYQTPVIILSDKLLSESHKSIMMGKFKLFAQNYKKRRGKIINHSAEKKYLRYKITDDGISTMLIPGFEGVYYQANSYEHVEDGHTTENAQDRTAQVKKRNNKTATYLRNDFKMPKIYGDINKASVVFVSWGSNKGAILAAMETLNNRAILSACLHFTHVFPLDSERIKTLFSNNKRYILVENNSHGQFGKLLRQETGINIKEKILKFDGRPIWPEEIIEYVNLK
ncbi:hypothetical protein A3C23_05725 [Candidatus Roizmanbacteria bacterium RIFCSPHIGHO2_02_FULL_37_13b]|uniref:2-oxoacid:ferredoxin oxidoreductase subunit alpha n=1 Tax=Candidatus Roizmanbacteria bacterium RIFCSPLOWO2_02_FULL_36_11 TaxID=1802071 RepID=A0A1F7JCC7_9BACT|nr:MAG: hypothetical protein A3C23_05725 [Candidatus Roizmanbacteria bacterium RIFCSPHIGHO2_02_FULL_37_13b]OGK53261.1 MAG: hypothetical protein A3H78_03065 [Candidatus Roizmanbacteria bacterium RIFCSPLOWO2_02_FULL_36_11]